MAKAKANAKAKAKSLQEAERIALAGKNESQDSQRFFLTMQEELGIGFRSSSPAAETTASKPPRSSRKEQSDEKAMAPKKGEKTAKKVAQAGQKTYGTRGKTRRSTRTTHSRDRDPPDSPETKSREPSAPVLEVDEGAGVVQDVLPAPSAPQPVADPIQAQDIGGGRQPAQSSAKSASPRRKMDASQVDDEAESGTTQSNEGRSYDQYLHGSDPLVDENECATEEQERFSHEAPRLEHGTLDENDTGAVRFSPDYLQASASGSFRDESGLVDFDRESALSPGPGIPETPAPHNPFANTKLKASVLPPSQLFDKSSAVKQGTSPTSSRPSPHDIHANQKSSLGTSSPIRRHGGPTSPRLLSGLPSSPGLAGVEKTMPAEVNTTTSQPSRPSRLAKKVGPEPKTVYEPMRKSQEKRVHSESKLEKVTSDDESPQRELRRVRARRQSANTRLESIRLPRQASVEVPSTEQKCRTVTAAERYLEQCHGTPEEAVSQDRRTVMDSQEQLEGPDASSPPLGIMTLSNPDLDEDPPATSLPKPSPSLDANTHFQVSSRDAIPETSPNEKSCCDTANPAADVIASSSLDLGPSRRRSSRRNRVPTSPPPPPPPFYSDSTTPAVIPGSLGSPSARDCPLQPTMVQNGGEEDELPENPPAVVGDIATLADPPGSENSTACVAASSADATNATDVSNQPVRGDAHGTIRSSPPVVEPRSTEAQALHLDVDKEKPRVSPIPPNGKPHGASAEPSSSLTSLSSVPSSTGTGTTNAVSAVAAEPCAASSKAVSVAKKKRGQKQGPSPRLAKPVDTLRQSKRLARHRSTSTDELARSPQYADTRHGGLLFKGMAFAVSFLDKRPHESKEEYNGRVELRKRVEKTIKDAGGRILDGFDDLFEPTTPKPANTSKSTRAAGSEDAPDLKLVNGAAALGFTALIADGHSRKVKYMQALALNLPCIAAPWISTCVTKKKIVDWAPYLLCAGESSLLDGAIRSRTLITKYNAADAQFRKVVDQRARMLEGSNVLLVMGAKSAEKRMPYVFLAQALGASISSVPSMPEAREKLKGAEDAGQPYDWVYVEDKADTGLLFGESATGQSETTTTTKKRKRASDPVGPAPKRIRTLNDQFIVQSLILEELLDESDRAS